MLMVPKSARAHSIKSRVVPKSAVARERVKHCVVYAPRKAAHRCSATCLIFLRVIPQALSRRQMLEGDTEMCRLSLISSQTSYRYIDGFSRIMPITNTSFTGPRTLLYSLLVCGLTEPVLSNKE